MEDAHSYVFDYDGVHGQGFFAVFDGHAGREAADWCGKNFHDVSLGFLYPAMIVIPFVPVHALNASSQPGCFCP